MDALCATCVFPLARTARGFKMRLACACDFICVPDFSCAWIFCRHLRLPVVTPGAVAFLPCLLIKPFSQLGNKKMVQANVSSFMALPIVVPCGVWLPARGMWYERVRWITVLRTDMCRFVVVFQGFASHCTGAVTRGACVRSRTLRT